MSSPSAASGDSQPPAASPALQAADASAEGAGAGAGGDAWAKMSDGARWGAVPMRRNAQRRVTVKLFAEDDVNLVRRLVTRHRLNARVLKAKVTEYKDGILEHGLLNDVNLLTGGGTLFDAMRAAINQNRHNPNCLDILKNGVENTIALDTTATDEEISWLKNVHDRFHGGQGATLAECYREAVESQKEWATFCRQNGITVSGCPKKGPYTRAKRFEAFILDRWSNGARTDFEALEADPPCQCEPEPPRLAPWSKTPQLEDEEAFEAITRVAFFEAGGAGRRMAMGEEAILERRAERERRAVAFTPPRAPPRAPPPRSESKPKVRDDEAEARDAKDALTRVAFFEAGGIGRQMAENEEASPCKGFCNKWVTYDNMKVVANQLVAADTFEYVVKTMEEGANSSKPGCTAHWAMNHAHALKVAIFSDTFTKTVEPGMLNLIFAEALQFTMPLCALEGEAKKKAAKRGSAGTAHLEKQEEQALQQPALTDGTPKAWTHDVAQCVASPAAILMETGSAHSDVLLASQRIAVRQSLTLLWDASLVVNGKAVKAWSKARKAIKSDIVKSNLRILGEACGEDDLGSLGPDAVAAKIASPLDKKDDGAAKPATTDPERDRLDSFLSLSRVMGLLLFIERNPPTLSPDLSAKFQGLMQIAGNWAKSNREMTKKITWTSLLQTLLPTVHEAYDEDAIIAATMPNVSEVSSGLFETVETMERVVSSRALWMLEAFKALATGPGRVTAKGATDFVGPLCGRLCTDLAAADASCADFADWRNFWVGLLNASAGVDNMAAQWEQTVAQYLQTDLFDAIMRQTFGADGEAAAAEGEAEPPSKKAKVEEATTAAETAAETAAALPAQAAPGPEPPAALGFAEQASAPKPQEEKPMEQDPAPEGPQGEEPKEPKVFHSVLHKQPQQAADTQQLLDPFGVGEIDNKAKAIEDTRQRVAAAKQALQARRAERQAQVADGKIMAETTEGEGKQFKSIATLRTLHKGGDIQMTDQLMFAFGTRLRSFVVEMSAMGASSSRTAAWRTLAPWKGVPGLRAKRVVPENLVLTFTGPVVRAPVKGALPVCDAMGTTFYITPTPGNLSCDHVCPAWSASIVEPTKHDPNPKTTLAVRMEERSLAFEWTHFGAAQRIEVTVTFYQMRKNPEPRPTWDGWDAQGGYVKLTRPVMSSQVTQVPKPADKGKGNGKGKKDNPFAACKHLLH
ncbi:unnamed protein product [Prorocentrum cordatum]|uniref:Uncharacterized protein n=1 Tax=Prorocentrum cordatum TaxID=2364126 RepID=A0ABN9QJL1_9DINO|nr:unnamed protein product [Polarella glacialis]